MLVYMTFDKLQRLYCVVQGLCGGAQFPDGPAFKFLFRILLRFFCGCQCFMQGSIALRRIIFCKVFFSGADGIIEF